MLIKEWMPTIRDIFQVLFFITVSTVTILTYLKAKKTLLQPIRTEIFKEQLKIFADILKEFTGKTEVELRSSFGFEKVFFANTWELYSHYASHFFDVPAGEMKKPYDDKEFPAAHFDPDTEVELCDDFVVREKTDAKSKPDPRTKTAIWGKHKVQMLKLPKELVDKQEEFRKIMDSPLLPKPLLALLDAYLSKANRNLVLLKELLTECAQEMPEKYSNIDELKNASFDWIHHRYLERFEGISPQAKKITDYLRDHFSVDGMLE